jgi:hypothetical protein
MRRTAARLPGKAFEPPAAMRNEEMCRISYHRPVDGCPTYVEHFKDGDDVPSRLCTIHQGSLKQRAQRVVQGVFGALGKSIREIFR